MTRTMTSFDTCSMTIGQQTPKGWRCTMFIAGCGSLSGTKQAGWSEQVEAHPPECPQDEGECSRKPKRLIQSDSKQVLAYLSNGLLSLCLPG